VLVHLKKYGDALPCLQRCAKLNPKYAEVRHLLGVALQEESRFREALIAFEVAVELDGSQPGYLNSEGEVLAKLGRYEDAVRCHESVVELAPNSPAGHYNLGKTRCPSETASFGFTKKLLYLD